MDKLTTIKIKYEDETYSDEIPVSVLAENVEWDSTHTLVDILGNIDTDTTGSIQDQISQLFNEKVSSTDLSNYVASQPNSGVTAENVEWDSTHTLVDVLGNTDVDVTGSIQDQISQLDETKVNKTNIVQNIGDSETDIMSQKAVTEEVTAVKRDLDKKADGIESLYKDGILRVSITSGNERIEHRITDTDIIYPNKSLSITGDFIDSQYSYGLARINLTDGIDLDNIVLSAFSRAGQGGSTTFCIYDNDDTLLFVGSNTNLGIPWDKTNKFIKDFTIPRSVIPDNASYMLVNFWNSASITWEHPFAKYTVDQKEVIASSNVTIPTSEKAEYVGTEHFKITINKNVLPESGAAVEEYEDDGVIFLPSSYTKSGKPTRLVISCHGSGTVIDENFNRESRSWNNFLITMGYAVLDVNGGVADSRHYNAPFAIQSYIKAYQYVVDKYNLYKEVFVLGASMGGLPAFTLAQLKTIPVKAVAGFCPVVDLYRQAWCQPWYSEQGDFSIQRKRIANYFGFDDGFSEWTTNQVPSTAEKQYFLDNIEKVKGYYPMLFGTINADKILTIDDGDYNDLVRITNVPTKIIQPDTDPTVSAVYGKYLISAIKNGGGIAEHKSYLSGGHTPSWGGTTTFDGVQCYDNEAELVKWFRRWE